MSGAVTKLKQKVIYHLNGTLLCFCLFVFVFSIMISYVSDVNQVARTLVMVMMVVVERQATTMPISISDRAAELDDSARITVYCLILGVQTLSTGLSHGKVHHLQFLCPHVAESSVSNSSSIWPPAI